jgi:hypothetical protein
MRMSAEADRTRSAIFFAQYLALLAAAAAWVQFPEVHARVGGHLRLFYLLLVVGSCYVLLRAYVVLVRRRDLRLRDVWVVLDPASSPAVYLTGGMNSEAGLLTGRSPPLPSSAIRSASPSAPPAGALLPRHLGGSAIPPGR